MIIIVCGIDQFDLRMIHGYVFQSLWLAIQRSLNKANEN